MIHANYLGLCRVDESFMLQRCEISHRLSFGRLQFDLHRISLPVLGRFAHALSPGADAGRHREINAVGAVRGGGARGDRICRLCVVATAPTRQSHNSGSFQTLEGARSEAWPICCASRDATRTEYFQPDALRAE